MHAHIQSLGGFWDDPRPAQSLLVSISAGMWRTLPRTSLQLCTNQASSFSWFKLVETVATVLCGAARIRTAAPLFCSVNHKVIKKLLISLSDDE